MNLSEIWNSIFGSTWFKTAEQDATTVVENGNLNKVESDVEKVVVDGETIAKDGTILVVDGETEIHGKTGGNVITDASKVVADGQQIVTDTKVVIADGLFRFTCF